ADVKIDEGTQPFEVEAAVLEHRRDDGYEASLQHGGPPSIESAILTDSSVPARYGFRSGPTAQIRCTIAGLGRLTCRSSYARTRSFPRNSSSSSPGRNRNSGLDGLPKRSLPSANVSYMNAP